MPEHLYTDHPELYDVIQSDWDYDRDVNFVIDVLGRENIGGASMLEVGCGTGEHTRRFVDAGFEVTAVDKYDGMLSVAREKCDAAFSQATLPDCPRGEYDVIVGIRGVVNHLDPDDLLPSLRALEDRLAPGGTIVFDNASLPTDGNHPAIDIGTSERGEYARIAHHAPAAKGRLDWNSITFPPDGGVVINSRHMTPFEDATIRSALGQLDLAVETVDGFGPTDDRTVFLARA